MKNIPKINPVVPDYSAYNLEFERASLRKFLESANLYIPENFYQHIREGDIVDLYTNPPEMKQLYCNQEFKRLSSYTEDQLKSNPFTYLFWRSDEVQLALIQKATQVCLFSNEAQAWDIGNHELIESLHPRKRTFEIDLGWVAPCFDKKTHQRTSFVSSLRVKLIFEWPDFSPISA